MTAQEPDLITYEGKERALLCNPLESYFKVHGRPKLVRPHTANGRGYVARFTIEDELLLLVGFQGWVQREGGEWHELQEVGWELLFPDGPERVQATWFSGVLRIPEGQCLGYAHMGYGSVYERDILLTIEEGRVVESRVVTNQPPSRVLESLGSIAALAILGAAYYYFFYA